MPTYCLHRLMAFYVITSVLSKALYGNSPSSYCQAASSVCVSCGAEDQAQALLDRCPLGLVKPLGSDCWDAVFCLLLLSIIFWAFNNCKC